MPPRDTSILGEEILRSADLDVLRRYFREARSGIEQIYEGASDEVKRRHFRILSEELVARGVRKIQDELEEDDRRLLETMVPDLERIVHIVFEEEFGLVE